MNFLFLLGIVIAIFAGINIGGTGIAPALGPAVGSKIIGKTKAGFLMAIFSLIGAILIGPYVVETLGGGITPSENFTLTASLVVMGVIGFSLFATNLLKIPMSTSQVAVGSVVGLGLFSKSLHLDSLSHVLFWWFITPILSFLIAAIIGRYFYFSLNEKWGFKMDKGILGKLIVILLGCYVAFSIGGNNAANAIAPLVGTGMISMSLGVFLGGLMIGLGAITIGRRTMDTVGNEITEISLMGAVIVSGLTAVIVNLLSILGVPISLNQVLTISVIGLGWGRASRAIESVGTPKNMEELFSDDVSKKIMVFWVITPVISLLVTYFILSLI